MIGNQNKKKIISNTNECIESCNYISQYKFEYNRKCYKNCKNVFLFDDNKNITSKCKGELGKCSLSPNASLKNELCTKCNTNYYPKENDPLNLGEYIICYKDLKGYYLDNDIYKQCYYKCKTCNMAGNNITHNCIDCNDNFPFKIEYYNYNNCYVNCKYYYYFDRENKYQCTQNSSCPAEFPVLLKETKKCIKHLFEEFKKYEQINIDEFSNGKKIDLYNKALENTEKGFTSENYDTSTIDKGQDQHLTIGNMKLTFTRADNQDNNIGENMTKVHLGKCEGLLRTYYNISENVTFYMRIVDVIQEKMDVSKIGFDVYCRLNGTNLERLKLTACEGEKIILSVPKKLSGDLQKLNASSSYYNDRCVSAKSGSGTDITTKDRQIDFVENGKIVCQENCDFSYYDEKNDIANCSCNFKETSSMTFEDMQIDKNKVS